MILQGFVIYKSLVLFLKLKVSTNFVTDLPIQKLSKSTFID